MKIYVICPVFNDRRGQLSKEVVENLEKFGHDVYWPVRDTDQTLPPVDICSIHRNEILEADLIMVLWDGKSKGCIFDLGMAWTMLKDNIQIVEFPEDDGQAGRWNSLINEWALNGPGYIFEEEQITVMIDPDELELDD